MLTGETSEGKRVQPHPQTVAYCPSCKEKLIPKCGDVRIWHFSHSIDSICDDWHRDETDWHREWKTAFPIECQEINLGPHRADIKIGDRILEFQHSKLSQKEIIEREAFYGQMIWVIDARESELEWFVLVAEPGRECAVLDFRKSLTWQIAEAPMILHVGGNDCLWLDQTDFGSGHGYAVYVQRPILIERFRSGNFSRPPNNLYRINSQNDYSQEYI